MKQYTTEERERGIYALIRSACEEHPDERNATVAETVLVRLGVKPTAIAVLRQLLEDEAGRYERSTVRNIERSVRRPVADGAAHDRIGLRAELLKASFVLSDGSRVTWGEATVAQHEDRIGMLERHRDGVTRTIEGHKNAIVRCEAAGASCLNEIVDAA